jgi:transposase
MRYMLTDDLWTALAPSVRQAEWYKGGQKPVLPDRDFFEAGLHLARTGAPWRDLPAAPGRWGAVYNRFRRWVASAGRHPVRETQGDVPRAAASDPRLHPPARAEEPQHALGSSSEHEILMVTMSRIKLTDSRARRSRRAILMVMMNPAKLTDSGARKNRRKAPGRMVAQAVSELAFNSPFTYLY